MKTVPYLVVPVEPPYRPFQVRRPVLPRPVVFAITPDGGDWPQEVDPSRGKTLLSPFDYKPMTCPYGATGDSLQVKIKGAPTTFRRNLIDVRIVSVTCEHSFEHSVEWVLLLARA
jgi:hypothetical protein